jgi:hypothetical protein
MELFPFSFSLHKVAIYRLGKAAHLTHNPMIEGYNPANGIVREKMANVVAKCLLRSFHQYKKQLG